MAAVAMAQVDFSRYSSLRWRNIGPYRGGRTVGIDCVWAQPNIWYIGVNNGGVWKSTDYGHTWNPVFDDQPTGSVGCLAIAQSHPDTVYVGSGEGLQRPDLSVGDGVYKTTDGGKTWTNMGLKDGLQISGIAVDPKDENRVFVAVLGHPYGSNPTRGLYRSTDGGKSWRRLSLMVEGTFPEAVPGKPTTSLNVEEQRTGAVAVAIDPVDPQTIYCSQWAARQAPWENGSWQGKTNGLFKSTDGGDHWKRLTGGFPSNEQGLGRIGFTVCRTNNRRLFACVDAPTIGGIYRSDDAGETWIRVADDARLWGRGSDFAEVRVDPSNPDTVYAANTSTYRSTDGGENWTCIKGAPGGDDFHTVFVHPTNSDLIGLAADQGATISVNHGETWSSWYNQPTAQFYHVSTDNRVPYWVYGGQQESGSAAVVSRGRNGHITFADWHPVGAEEYAYVAPDPLDPNLVFGSKGSRYDDRTGITTNVRPKIEGLRYVRTMPMLFSVADPHMLFLASNKVLLSKDRGANWAAISPDLTRAKWDVPAPFATVSDEGKTMKQRGVVYAIGPSPRDPKVIWAGTDDGLVWVTQDGGANWADVTPSAVTSWSKVSQIDAGHFATGTAYVSVNRLRCDDLKPYIYVTKDFGKTWILSVGGLANDPVNAVREDPVKQGLLYAATERMVWFSTDDGGHWSQLRLNMPSSSIRDIVVKDNDLVVGTHGRGFWICDQIGRLRDMNSVFVSPSWAWLYENNLNQDTPLPPEEPAGENPPDGVPVDYFLTGKAGFVKLEVVDAKGKVVRSYSSAEPEPPIDPKAITVDPRWARPPAHLGVEAGSHRFVWDMRTAGVAGRRGLGMAAVWQSTPATRGTLVAPGKYTLRLTVDGAVHERSLDLKAVPVPFGATVGTGNSSGGSDDD